MLSINDTVTESKHKLEMVSTQQHADKEEIKRLEIVKEYLEEVEEEEKEGTENEQ